MLPAAIGPFQILRELGRGGMGEVYLALDTRLDRKVAIKALPADLAQNPDRLARFQREAKVLASLNHPGIGGIYGLEETQGHQYLILEFVEGETLADRLSRGPIPVDETLTLARQIAEAIEVAHEKGVIHRDLKPGNVMITPEGAVKVLDFGLARIEEAPSSSGAAEAVSESLMATSPVRVHSPTIPGAIMGSAGYMSPEQARGKAVDKRSDIFSFGCVLYEMLSGTMPFRGETVADAIGATLHKELDLSLLPPGSPAPLVLLLKRCLMKDRQHRMRDIGDARVELEQLIADPQLGGLPSPNIRPAAHWLRSPATIAAMALLGAAIVVIALLANALRNASGAIQPVPPVTRATLALHKGAALRTYDRSVALSPDGTQVVVAADPTEDSTADILQLRTLSGLDFRPLRGTDGASYPFWSPDGRSIGFFADGKLKRVDLAEDIVRVICDAPAGRGGSWGSKGTIIFAPSATGGLFIVSESGGTPVRVTNPASASMSHRVPQMLPDGESFLFFSQSERRVFAVGPASKEPKLVMPADAEAMFVEPGFLVFIRDDNLMVQPFDPKRLELSGSAIPIAGGVRYDFSRGFLNLGISARGPLVYQAVTRAPKCRLAWMDLAGQRIPINIEALPIHIARLAPDARRALAEVPGDHGESTIAVLDLERGTRTQIGEPKKSASYPIWSNKAQSVLYVSERDDGEGIVSVPAAGGGQSRFIVGKPGNEFNLGSVTPDGNTLIFSQVNSIDKTGDIMTINLQGEGAAKPFMITPLSETWPRISPAGDALAFLCDVTNVDAESFTLNAVAYPSPGSPVQVSLTRMSGQWGWLGPHDLYWVDASRRVWSASITVNEGQADAAAPKAMLDERPLDMNTTILDYDTAHQRFLLATLEGTVDAPEIVVVTDWRPDSMRTSARSK